MPPEDNPAEVEAWPAERFGKRMLNCLAMLVIHDCVTQEEKFKIRRRIEKLLSKEVKELLDANPEQG